MNDLSVINLRCDSDVDDIIDNEYTRSEQLQIIRISTDLIDYAYQYLNDIKARELRSSKTILVEYVTDFISVSCFDILASRKVSTRLPETVSRLISEIEVRLRLDDLRLSLHVRNTISVHEMFYILYALKDAISYIEQKFAVLSSRGVKLKTLEIIC